MNDRIKELAEQAEILITEAGAFHNTPQGAYQLQEQHMKKFAELIVRECVGIAYKFDEPKLSGPGMIIGNRIEEHFGVEE